MFADDEDDDRSPHIIIFRPPLTSTHASPWSPFSEIDVYRLIPVDLDSLLELELPLPLELFDDPELELDDVLPDAPLLLRLPVLDVPVVVVPV